MRILLLTSPQAGMAEAIHADLTARFPGVRIDWAQNHAEAKPHLPYIDGLMTFGPFMSNEMLAEAPRLKWIQSLGSGMDGIIDLTALRKDIMLTSGRGAQAAPVSETVLALMFALSRDLPRMLANQRHHTWERWAPRLLAGSTVVLVGLGAIAEALAPKCKALGMCTIGVSSHCLEMPGCDLVVARTALRSVTGQCDYLVVLAPYSRDSHHLIDAHVLAAMQPTACIVNVSRGGVVDEQALLTALQRGTIAGAALDVFAKEPLSAGNPLWALTNVIVSPHMGGLHQAYARDLLPILRANLAAFLSSQRAAMMNVVSPMAETQQT